jgi:hypothetical protein
MLNAIKQIDENQQEAIRYLAAKNLRNMISKHNTTTKQHKQQLHLIKQIKQKLHNNNLTLVEADKGRTMVIIHEQTLEDKVTPFINNNHIDTLKTTPHKKCIGKSKIL